MNNELNELKHKYTTLKKSKKLEEAQLIQDEMENIQVEF